MENEEIKARWPGSCFGCSPTNPHGLKLRFRHADQGCVNRCVIPDTLFSPTLYCGFGRPDLTLEITATDLARLTAGQVASFSR